MKRIHSLDFMQARPTPWLGWAAAGIGLIVLAAVALPLLPLVQDNQMRADALRTISRQTQEDSAQVIVQSPAERRRQAQSRRLLQQLDAPWNELFALLEQHADPQVGLLRIEPDAGSGQIRLMAMCKDLGVMATWLRRLEQDPRLSDVQIVQHQIEELAPGRPVRFNLVARWRGAPAGGKVAAARQTADPVGAGLSRTGGQP
ncbi:fimbrial assembly [Leptothrix cholodnii SP-6]|uniref:Fimbrial assembly n=1 Tax=Leptothrix cholodnii (strain ATCC 51168 / LMG 8142 / SP-6) TaxID=395495 RepID=B1Y7C6_LEPCP|nr:fimbrial assembly [Leptothrix cholodnii]ACB34881.1 fimbrial assembly [Leptothrix cholodnii SP-6]